MKKDQVVDAVKHIDKLLGETEILIVGSQSLHGAHPGVPDEILYSREVDMVLVTKSKLGNWLSEVVGPGTHFEYNNGYYIDHVFLKDDFPILAKGWRDRVVKEIIDDKINVSYLSPEDLAIAKLAAGRDKDILFVAGMIKKKLVDLDLVRSLAGTLDEEMGKAVIDRLDALPSQNAPRIGKK